jgi:hypothetical protein
MQYKSLHFDNEVINALYSPKDQEYWRFYMESFENQIIDNLHFIEKRRPDIPDDFILAAKKDSVKRMMTDLQSLEGDLLIADSKSALAKWIKMRFEGIELFNAAYKKN